jgi:AcrR family transcriptional regulator
MAGEAIEIARVAALAIGQSMEANIRKTSRVDGSPPKRGPGRPRSFDRAVALELAMKLFWEHGYEGTTFDELIDTMGISPSSFYLAFGSKEKLYEESSGHFMTLVAKWFERALAHRNVRTAFANLLAKFATEFTQKDCPAGCMISLAGTHIASDLNSIRDAMRERRRLGINAMKERLALGIAAGELAPETNIDTLAMFFSTVMCGMAVKARDGCSREGLLEIGSLAMRAWPSPSHKKRSTSNALVLS